MAFAPSSRSFAPGKKELSNEEHLFEAVVRDVTDNEDTGSLASCFRSRYNDTELKCAVQEICDHASESTLNRVVSVLPDYYLDVAVEAALRRRLWVVVDCLLRREIDCSARRQLVEEAIQHASEEHLESILPRCSRNQLYTALDIATTRRLWGAVGKLLASCEKEGTLAEKVTEASLTHTVSEASKDATDHHLRELLKFCPRDLLERVATEAVGRGLWESVEDLLKTRAMSGEARSRVIKELLKRAPEFACSNVVCCCRHNLWTAREHAVQMRFWRVVDTLLKHASSGEEELLQWVLVEACKHADVDTLTQLFCGEKLAQENADAAVKELIARGPDMWDLVIDLMESSVSNSTRRFVVEEALKTADDNQLSVILPQCVDDQVDFVLKETAKKNMWEAVEKLLKRTVSDATRKVVVRDAAQRAPHKHVNVIIRYCSADHADVVLQELVIRRLWVYVDYLLSYHEVSSTARGQAIEEASKQAGEYRLRFLIRHCTADVFHSVLHEIVRRDLWEAVNPLLKTCTDETCGRSAMDEAVKRFNVDVNRVTKQAVERGAWAVVGCLLHRSGASPSTRQSAMNKVFGSRKQEINCSKQEFRYMIAHVHPSQLMPVLQTAVRSKVNGPYFASATLKHIGQRCDPRCVCETLLFLVQNLKEVCHQLVVECIRLGVSTHQQVLPPSTRTSPILHAAVRLRDLTTVQMLYESGACCLEELSHFRSRDYFSGNSRADFRKVGDYVRMITTTPRSLKSMCRLVISNQLGVGSSRQEKVKQLPLPESLMNYVTFQDIENIEANVTSDESD